ncbi:MAG TPA: helix-turn-helix domain-containing protein [Candidatus Nanoarchaeia archaeon]|nr:helix-turn-helix domain-containing protein [Candidatus Nanoarchaeia archaeon]
MIVQKEFLTKLREFGLNSYESKLWSALLSRGSSTAGELSDISNVPRSRSYDVLESLERKGFILMKPGKPIRYVAVPPEEVIDRIKKKISQTTSKQMDMLSKLNSTKVIGELNSLYDQGLDLIEPVDMTGSIKGRENLYNHMETMIKKATKQVIIATSSEGLVRKVAALKETLEAAKQRGVQIRLVAPQNSKTKESIKPISKIVEIKDIDVKTRLCVVDGKEILFMLSDDQEVHPSYDVGVWVNTPFFGNVLVKALGN